MWVCGHIDIDLHLLGNLVCNRFIESMGLTYMLTHQSHADSTGNQLKVKVKVPLDNCLVMSDSRGPCSSPFPSRRASVCPKTVSVVMWPARLDTERCYLPTKVVPIYLLAFLHAFELLSWQELGQATGAHSVAWIQSYNCCSSDLAAQRLLQFNPPHPF